MLPSFRNNCFFFYKLILPGGSIKYRRLAEKNFSFFLHLLNLQRYFIASPHRLLDALVEGGEERVALQYIAGGMNLAHQDAAPAHRKRTVAGLNHRTWQGGEG